METNKETIIDKMNEIERQNQRRKEMLAMPRDEFMQEVYGWKPTYETTELHEIENNN